MPATARISAYYFAYFAFVGAFTPYFGLYLQSSGFSAWDIGLLMSQMQLMRLFGPFFWGTLADKGLPRGRIIRLAALISLCGFSAFFWFNTLEPLLIAMAVLAFFWSAALPLVETLTFDHLKEHPGRYGQIRMWGSIGFVVAVLATGKLLDHLAVDSVLWVCWLILAGILFFAVGLPNIAHHESAHQQTIALKSILRQTKVRALLAACFAMSAAHGVLYIFYSIHLAEHGYAKTAIGLLWSLGVVIEILVFMAMPKLTARWTLRSIMLACYATAAIRFVMIGWTVDWLWLAIIAQVMHGLTFGAHHASSIAAINQWFPGKSQARGQALYSSLSFGAGGLLGGLLSGYLWQPLGGAITFSISALFAVAGYLLIWRYHPKDDEAKHAH